MTADFDNHGFGPESALIYEMPIGSTQVPDPNGNAWFAPNLFKFTLAKDNTIYPTSTISEPYDVKILVFSVCLIRVRCQHIRK